MNAKHLLGVGTLLALANSGCVSCHYKAQPQFLAACHSSTVPSPVRNHVYLFMMNGSDVFDFAGLTTLRDKVCEAGFPKVYYAQRADRRWYELEMRRVYLADPAARFVVLGMGTATDHLVPLVVGVVEDGLPVDQLILLDPIGTMAGTSSSVPVTVLQSRSWSHSASASENVTMMEASHFGLPASAPVVEAVISQMIASAQQVGPLEGPRLPALPLSDKPAPLPRPRELPPHEAAKPDAWDFLKRGVPSGSELLPYPAEAPRLGDVPAIPVSRTK
ncbi:MAG: hypothetical protein LC104_01375 [Bacteroidales bacterium]|nr:hypothetical protein [Bacteroidales bacterium]